MKKKNLALLLLLTVLAIGCGKNSVDVNDLNNPSQNNSEENVFTFEGAVTKIINELGISTANAAEAKIISLETLSALLMSKNLGALASPRLAAKEQLNLVLDYINTNLDKVSQQEKELLTLSGLSNISDSANGYFFLIGYGDNGIIKYMGVTTLDNEKNYSLKVPLAVAEKIEFTTAYAFLSGDVARATFSPLEDNLVSSKSAQINPNMNDSAKFLTTIAKVAPVIDRGVNLIETVEAMNNEVQARKEEFSRVNVDVERLKKLSLQLNNVIASIMPLLGRDGISAADLTEITYATYTIANIYAADRKLSVLEELLQAYHTEVEGLKHKAKDSADYQRMLDELHMQIAMNSLEFAAIGEIFMNMVKSGIINFGSDQIPQDKEEVSKIRAQ